MRLFLALFGVVMGLSSLGMVCGNDEVLQNFNVGEANSGGGFLSSVLSLPKKVVVLIFKAIGAVMRFIFVRIPQIIIDTIKRLYYRAAHLFGKKDPYDTPATVVLGEAQQTYNSYPGYYNQYRNPYGRTSR